jgi:hypothetical protein
MNKDDIPETASHTHKDHCKVLVMLFSLTNALPLQVIDEWDKKKSYFQVMTKCEILYCQERK